MLILKRKNGDIETFEIPDSVLVELQKLCLPASEKKEVDSLTAAAIDLYKMEYERAVERYNNLYNSAWTNFSYMVLVAGGIATFGGERFVTFFNSTSCMSAVVLLVGRYICAAKSIWR